MSDVVNPYLTKVIVSNGPDKGKSFLIDIYDVISAFAPGCNIAHAQGIKKSLRRGRSDKSSQKDLREAIESFQRAMEIEDANADS